MEFTALEDLFFAATCRILGDGWPEGGIRLTYPQDGQPSWKIDEEIVFIRLFEREDDYAKQLDSIYDARGPTVVKKSARTRVWDVGYTAYGPHACETVNKIKDGMFRQDVKRILAKHAVYLIPDLPPCRRVPELFAGQWWQRWDLTLKFNELYRLPDEDIGRIDSVSIRMQPNR